MTGRARRRTAMTPPQERLTALLAELDSWEAELAGTYASVPAPEPAEADRMERGECPESVDHALRTAIECLRVDGLPRIRAILSGAVATRVEELEHEWRARLGGHPPIGEG